MNQAMFISVLCGFAMATSPAIAQPSPIPPHSTPDEAEELSLTENASSSDLVTQPARSTSAALEPVEAFDPAGTFRQIQLDVYDVRLIEGYVPDDPGPANADHVQFVIEG